jgi:hypothetical protein
MHPGSNKERKDFSMETSLSLHNYLSFVIAGLVAVAALAYYFTRRVRLSRAAVLHPHLPPRTLSLDNPCDALLSKAQLLLDYAADNGIKVEESTSRAIYNFRLTNPTERPPGAVDDLFHAYITLSDALKPINIESIKETALKRNRGVQKYRKIVFILSLFVIPFSILAFVSSAMSTKIGEAIDQGNSLIVQLRTELGANFSGNSAKLNDYDTIIKVQQLYTTARSLYVTSNEIKYTLFGLMPQSPAEPTKIPPGLSNVPGTIEQMIPEFQELRQYGQTGRDLVAVIYGAISTCILPVLYALIGVCAKLLGQFEQQIRTRTYVQSEANSAHFVVAAIAGGVVGLFNNFTLGQSASVPPLAVAFLVGFSVDVFFSFLETLSQSFVKRPESHISSKPSVASV